MEYELCWKFVGFDGTSARVIFRHKGRLFAHTFFFNAPGGIVAYSEKNLNKELKKFVEGLEFRLSYPLTEAFLDLDLKGFYWNFGTTMPPELMGEIRNQFVLDAL